MKKQVSESYTSSSRAEAVPGAFMPDGSFNEDAGWTQQGPAHALVASLVRQRRAGSLTPTDAVSLIRSARADQAFPSLGQWETCGPWPACWTQTPSEEAVKRAGLGTDGHWCGQAWASGPEKACAEDRHRDKPDREEVKTLVECIGQGLSKASSLPANGKTPPGTAPEPCQDEIWPGWAPVAFPE